jgi:hypothetical protein
MFRRIAQSPAAVRGFTANKGALTKTLAVKTQRRIAPVVTQLKGRAYSLSARSYLSVNPAKISSKGVALNWKGESRDATANAAVHFTATVGREPGHTAEADLKAVRDGGYGDGQIAEILAVTAENIFATLLNVVAQTDIDFGSCAPATRREASEGWQLSGSSPAPPSHEGAPSCHMVS